MIDFRDDIAMAATTTIAMIGTTRTPISDIHHSPQRCHQVIDMAGLERAHSIAKLLNMVRQQICSPLTLLHIGLT